MTADNVRPTVLLIDDDQRGAPLREIILEQTGYRALPASSLADAARLLSSEPVIDALLVATSYLDPATLELCAQVKAEGGPPVLFLSHTVWPARWERVYCDAHIHKLEGPATWLATLNKLITERSACPPQAGRSVLNVDDNDIQRYAVTRMLRAGGYVVIEAATGMQTLQLARNSPDLILLDINLPDIDGFEVCRRLRANPETAKIPIVHLTATFTKPESRARALNNGADDFLCQPIASEALLGKVGSLLQKFA